MLLLLKLKKSSKCDFNFSIIDLHEMLLEGAQIRSQISDNSTSTNLQP